MSRSYKKFGVIKDNGGGKKYSKKLSHHRERVAVRTIISNIHTDNPAHVSNYNLIFPKHRPHELINPYDVCDWKWGTLYWGTDGMTKKDIRKYHMK